ncbi:exocyst complex component 3-like protein isoform X2 [Pelobates fuscus]|uniref:exocyst complex component 3-like protein isoform X2 n=1 Tax=Pelobates fuscus TaxID=191477 RepID=UPI002FE467B9
MQRMQTVLLSFVQIARLTMSADEGDVLALEKAESLARGAALKWASGIFCRPDQLTRLGHYRRRETQRNNSIQSRLKSTAQSYLEGVEQGVAQLRRALTEVHNVQQALSEAQEIWHGSEEIIGNLQPVQKLVMEHVQLSVVLESLPYIYSVPELLSQTHVLIERQRLLEAHVNLRDLESLRDDVLYRLQRVGPLSAAENGGDATELVEQFFAGVQNLSEELGQTIFSLASSSLSLACSDPTLLVSAVRIIEREESLDLVMSGGSPTSGRPKRWRESFFQTFERGVCERLLPSSLDEESVSPAGLACHLQELQDRLLAELQAVSSILTPCVPPHYELSRTVALMCHRAVSRHARDILNIDLTHPSLYFVLHWILNVYPSEDLMAHPDLASEVDLSELGPLVSPEIMEEQLNRYTRSVRACLSQWMQKALEAEYADWFREQEPDKDQDGLFISSLQQLIMQMLSENIGLASALGTGLESRVRTAAVHEMDNCLVWLREALIKYGIEHMRDRTVPPFYIPYLIATINGCLALSSSMSYLQSESPSDSLYRKAGPCLQTSLGKTQKKACHLLLEELQMELQPFYTQIPSRPWILGSEIIHVISDKVENFSHYLCKVRDPVCQVLRAQTERMLIIEYVKALIHGKLVCKNSGERQLLAERMCADAEVLSATLSRMGLEQSSLCIPLILSLQELFALKDPSLLSLEVSGLMTMFPDISDDHVLALLELRGDVSRDVRHGVINTMQNHALSLPLDYQPIFTSIPVPAPPPSFCLHPSSCA